MPTCCDMCWALDDYGDYPRCRITGEQRGYNFRIRENRMDNCPLVPVPPHGRLIDAKYVRDEIIQEWMDKADDSHMYKRGMEDAYEVIRNAPTIIPAEEDNNTDFWDEEYSEAKGLKNEGKW